MAERWINHGAQPGWAPALAAGRVIEEKSLARLTRSVRQLAGAGISATCKLKSGRLTKV